MGGLPKRQTLLDSDTSAIDQRILVDAGSLLFSQTTLSQGRSGEQAKVNAQGIIRALNGMGYDAVGISKMDLAAGADFLVELQKEADFAFLSANLVNKADNSLVFNSHIIKDLAGLRIAVVGLTGPIEEKLPGTIQLKKIPWQDTLPRLIQKISTDKTVQVIILLSSEPPEVNRAVSQKFPGVNIIVQTSDHPRNMAPKLINNTLLCQTDKQGKYLGRLNIKWNTSGIWQNQAPGALTILRQEQDRIAWQLGRIRSKGDPETLYSGKEANLRAYRKLVERKHSVDSEIATLQNTGQDQSHESVFQNTFLELAPEVADDKLIADIVKKTKKDVNSIGRNKGKEQMLVGYAGSSLCSQCHADISDRWQKTGHAHAYATLEKKEQQYNTNCLPCHVTGISMQDKNLSLSIPESLRNVGCETCHGPALNHSKNPEKWPITNRPYSSLCLQCHSEERDDSFDFDRDIRLVH